jgi:hypothetical protein
MKNNSIRFILLSLSMQFCKTQCTFNDSDTHRSVKIGCWFYYHEITKITSTIIIISKADLDSKFDSLKSTITQPITPLAFL